MFRYPAHKVFMLGTDQSEQIESKTWVMSLKDLWQGRVHL